MNEILNELIVKLLDNINIEQYKNIPELSKIDHKSDALVDKLDCIDKQLSEELDKLTGELALDYSELFFKKGFKAAFEFMKEINNL